MRKKIVIAFAILCIFSLASCSKGNLFPSKKFNIPNDVEVVELGDSFLVNDKFMMTITTFELSDDSNEDYDVYDFKYQIEFTSNFAGNSTMSFNAEVYPEGACLYDNGVSFNISRPSSNGMMPSNTNSYTTILMAKNLEGDVYLDFGDIWAKVK